MTGPGSGPRLVLEVGDTRLEVLPGDGGRIGSVIVAGRELLVTSDPAGAVYWGCYPMAPWAGRIRHGRFTHAGREHHVPVNAAPHALHGVVYDRPWSVVAADTIAIEMDERWPFRGRVTQRFALHEDGLEVAMTVEVAEPQPVVVGWHPWFRRVIEAGTAPVRFDFRPDVMLVRDGEGIPTGERATPGTGPWDDVFTDLAADPVLEWPGLLRVVMWSSCAWWVAYDMPANAICVEPQSGPPDGVTLVPETVSPGSPLVHTMRWAWTRLDRQRGVGAGERLSLAAAVTCSRAPRAGPGSAACPGPAR